MSSPRICLASMSNSVSNVSNDNLSIFPILKLLCLDFISNDFVDFIFIFRQNYPRCPLQYFEM